MTNYIQISELVSVDQKNGAWRMHVKTGPGKRPKITTPGTFINLCQHLLTLKAGDCKTLAQLIALHQGVMKGIESYSSPENKADQLRMIGMAKAEGNANKAIPRWSDLAIAFIERCPLEEFVTEELREWAHANGLPEPPKSYAWGGVIVKAANKGLITANGYKNTKSSASHGRTVPIWINNRLQEKAA